MASQGPICSTPQKGDDSSCNIELPPEYDEVTKDDHLQEIIVVVRNDGVPCALDEDVSDGNTSSSSSFFASFSKIHSGVGSFIERHKTLLRWLVIGLFSASFLAYFVWALVLSVLHKCQNPASLIALTCFVLFCIVVWYIRTHFQKSITTLQEKVKGCIHENAVNVMKIVFFMCAVVGVITIIGVTVWKQPGNLICLGGVTVFLIILWIFSAHPTQVNWRPVIGGLLLQFYFAVIILKWDTGYLVFKFLGERVQTFLSFTDYGSQFVFGEKFTDHIFAMKVLPVVVFFSCAINVLYYIGAMQMIIAKIGWVLRKVLGTTAPESLCAAANIFVGQSEAPIMIRPFMDLMTKSELNAVMTGGFATIAGGVMAAYISFGVPPEHLLCASVMNAPCALAVSKLLYPEVEPSRIRKATDINLSEKKERNILEAAAAGASASIKLVANIAANLIAFLAMLAFVNAVLSWFGGFVCHPELSFQLICSYLFMPIAYLMGVEWEDAGVVGELVGIKTFLNEFVAYKELSTFIENRNNCLGEMISLRSQVIATYALCGFSNLSSIGIQLGSLGPMAPHRRGDLAEVVIRSLFGGILVCLITASWAGLLIVDLPADECLGLSTNTTLLNVTASANVTEYLVNSTMNSLVS